MTKKGKQQPGSLNEPNAPPEPEKKSTGASSNVSSKGVAKGAEVPVAQHQTAISKISATEAATGTAASLAAASSVSSSWNDDPTLNVEDWSAERRELVTVVGAKVVDLLSLDDCDYSDPFRNPDLNFDSEVDLDLYYQNLDRNLDRSLDSDPSQSSDPSLIDLRGTGKVSSSSGQPQVRVALGNCV